MCNYFGIQKRRLQAMHELQRKISLFSLLEKVYVKCLESKCLEIAKLILQDEWRSFGPFAAPRTRTYITELLSELVKAIFAR